MLQGSGLQRAERCGGPTLDPIHWISPTMQAYANSEGFLSLLPLRLGDCFPWKRMHQREEACNRRQITLDKTYS